jgi:hypothetical protein
MGQVLHGSATTTEAVRRRIGAAGPMTDSTIVNLRIPPHAPLSVEAGRSSGT